MSKKPAWIYIQSGVIPILDGKIIIISTRKGKNWIIPKGIVEKNLSPEKSAELEALEEAGVTGKISKEPIGKYKYEKWGDTCTVTVYPLFVERLMDDWDEKHFRERIIVSPSKALELVKQPGLKKMIKKYFDLN